MANTITKAEIAKEITIAYLQRMQLSVNHETNAENICQAYEKFFEAVDKKMER